MRPPQLTAQHFKDASTEGNLLLSSWSNTTPLLWTSEIHSQLLTQGVATYTLDPQTVTVLDIYIETTSGSQTTGRILGAVSTTEYDAFPDKVTQGSPSVYWLNRLLTPQVTFWQPPDGNGPYTAKVRIVRQPQDSVIQGGVTVDAPFRFLDAYVAGLSHRLARIHAQPLEAQRKSDYDEAWALANNQDVEATNFFVAPQLAGYFR